MGAPSTRIASEYGIEIGGCREGRWGGQKEGLDLKFQKGRTKRQGLNHAETDHACAGKIK